MSSDFFCGAMRAPKRKIVVSATEFHLGKEMIDSTAFFEIEEEEEEEEEGISADTQVHSRARPI